MAAVPELNSGFVASDLNITVHYTMAYLPPDMMC